MKKYGITLCITIVLTLSFMFFRFNTWTALALINAITITSLVLIIIGAILFVSGQGFFSGIIYSFRRFFKKTAKDQTMIDDPDEEFTVRKNSFSLTTPFLLIGGGLFIISLIIAYAAW